MKLTFEALFAAYKKKTVLENISFCADSGTVTALIGRNGAGKSTLIRCLTGEKRDYSGTILLDGQDARAFSRAELAATVSCLPQELPQPHVTVWDLVRFGRTPYTPLTGKLTQQDLNAIDWAIRAVGLEIHRDTFVDTLSGGERKKAFFAMTLAQDTPVIALDEPTAHLDAASCFEFLDLIKSLGVETGKTVLLVMHNLPEVLRYADRIVALHGGSIVFDGIPARCLEDQIPQRYFGIHLHGDTARGYGAVPVILNRGDNYENH